MNPIPPEWNNERKLWETLGNVPLSPPSSNFAFMVRQKLAKTAAAKPESRFFDFSFLTRWRGWPAQLAAVAAAGCVVWIAWLWKAPSPAPLSVSEIETVELVQVAQNFELIQDFETIEHLDEL